MLADGLPSSAEYMIGNGSLAAHETCVGTDYPWTLNEGVFTSRVPQDFETEGGEKYINLVPYGSTTLRLTLFPTE